MKQAKPKPNPDPNKSAQNPSEVVIYYRKQIQNLPDKAVFPNERVAN